MRKIFIAILAPIFSLLFVGAVFAADVAITSIGQSADAMMVKVLMKKLNVAPDYDTLMKIDALSGQKVLIAVVGGSSKGLGSAGINKEEEKNRGVNLIEAARSKNIKILIMHVGGEARRGDLSDMFIDAVTPLGDKVVVVKSGNADGIFGKAKADGATLVEADSIQATAPFLEEIFKDWGVTQ